MATKGKESPSLKEKKVTSSHTRKTNTSRSPNTSKQASPVKRHDSTTASERHIPNYLKPTISSGLDPSAHQHKKNASSESKSNFARRKSFDKPLLPSPTQKARTSPSPNERSFRSSSSFTTRSTTSQKSLPDKLLKSAKDVGKGKKSNTNIKKDEKESSSTKEQETSTNADDTPENIDVIVEVAPQQEDLDVSSITQVDDEQVLNSVNNNETATEVLGVEDDRQYEVGSDEVEEVKMEEASMKGRDEPTSFEIEKTEEIMKVGESSKNQLEHVDETIESKDQVEEDGETKAKENGGGQEEMEQKEEGNIEGSSTEDVDDHLQETENAAEDQKKDIKSDVENEETKQQVLQGKKESSVSNDVIEETATKLREQRKNKVKALAGAFESVISLQEPK